MHKFFKEIITDNLDYKVLHRTPNKKVAKSDEADESDALSLRKSKISRSAATKFTGTLAPCAISDQLRPCCAANAKYKCLNRE